MSLWPDGACSRCGSTAEDDYIGRPPVDITVITADGEEGYARVTQLYCDDCFVTVIEILQGLGFVDHRHGSIDFLEDMLCPGYDDMRKCPTPTVYGDVLVTLEGPKQHDDFR